MQSAMRPRQSSGAQTNKELLAAILHDMLIATSFAILEPYLPFAKHFFEMLI